MMQPIVESVAHRIKIHEIDVDEVDPLILSTYNIKSIPVLIVEDDDSNILWRHNGTIKQSELEEKLDELNSYITNENI